MAKVNCPACGKVLKVPDTAEGKSARCPACGAGFRIRLQGGTAPAGSAPRPAGAGGPRKAPADRELGNSLLESLAADARQSPAAASDVAGPAGASSSSSSSDEVGFAEEPPAPPPPRAPAAPSDAPPARPQAALTPLRIGAFLACLILPVGLFLPWASGEPSRDPKGRQLFMGVSMGSSKQEQIPGRNFSGLEMLEGAGKGFYLAEFWAFAPAGMGAALFGVASIAGAASAGLSLRPGAKRATLMCPALAATGLVLAAIGIVALQVTTPQKPVLLAFSTPYGHGACDMVVGASPVFWVVLAVCLLAGGLLFLQQARAGRAGAGKDAFAMSPQAFGVAALAVALTLTAAVPWMLGTSPAGFVEILSIDTSGAPPDAISKVRGMGWGGLIFCIGAGLSAVAALVWAESGFGTPKIAGGAAALAGVGIAVFAIALMGVKDAVGEAAKAAMAKNDPLAFVWGFYVTIAVVLAACLVHFTARPTE